ncbi:hypothetical protein L4174_019835 [Photobacterium sp. CCB-ST2H9]|uniref:DUF6765 family protein n=1 Tax=Photobacterium sp. CCB-ST2H9 TaxID=2912855 RepID=UPI0020062D6C|nr:DUF6765 family protein [Photobacterium sp. CCB-ST2H9]UTM60306.1 hypothetical protein L4174_019835 [Photobacterium sp. CCB-ST2H9]
MQIDGHHAMTYVVARYAGLNHHQASVVAYCAQYVDEATNENPIYFENGAMFDRIVSAHKMLDYRNTVKLANHMVWIPFHFLPGNHGNEAGHPPEGRFINRLICMPDSPVARDMLRMVATHWHKPYALHMLGIAMHVYADTFAHQGFAGVVHDINRVESIESAQYMSLAERIRNDVLRHGISSTSPLGHGAALSFPDRPYASWIYVNGTGETVVRDNTEIFVQAADAMCKAIQCYLAQDHAVKIDQQPGLTAQQRNLIESALRTFDDEDGERRHEQWLQHIATGDFGFAAEVLTFHKTGPESWKEKARGPAIVRDGKPYYKYSESFFSSDWKFFHDALKTYRLELIRDVLPAYGICVA